MIDQMPTAIVTITCPQCGGKVAGIEATDQAQVIPCTYCKTELHVPRVGDEVIREKVVVVHEVTAPPLQRRPPVKPAHLAIIFGVFAALFIAFFVAAKSDADAERDRFEKRQADEQACKDECKRTCGAAPAPAPTLKPEDVATMPDDMRKTIENNDRTIQEATFTSCDVDCEMKKCFRLGR